MKEKLVKSSVAIVCALLLYFIPSITIPWLDNNADEYFSEAIEEATIAYGTARIINASISVIKESELQIEPGGVGLSLAIGQILDPVDDITERLSDVLLTAIISLGIQKLTFEIGISIIPKILALVLVILAILIWFNNDKVVKYNSWLKYIAVILLATRFFLPISSLMSDYLYYGFFQEKIETATTNLEFYSDEIETINYVDVPDSEGFWDSIKNNALYLGEKAKQFKDVLYYVADNISDIVGRLVEVTWLYVGLFVIQILLLPLFMLWLMLKLVNKIFETN